MNFVWGSYSNPVYSDDIGDKIDCIIDMIEPPYGPIPFTANKYDIEEHGKTIYKEIIDNADNIDIAPYIPPPEPIKPISTEPKVI